MRLAATLFRLTRDVEVELDGHADHDVRELVREQIRQRRYEPVVRLEIGTRSAGPIERTLQERFALTPEDLRDAPSTPVTPARALKDIPDRIRCGISMRATLRMARSSPEAESQKR
jgi:polyphosphate kinase